MFNIMIVEDDTNQRKLMQTVLEQYGYNVIINSMFRMMRKEKILHSLGQKKLRFLGPTK